jgi:hypothetical protein
MVLDALRVIMKHEKTRKRANFPYINQETSKVTHITHENYSYTNSQNGGKYQ